MLSETHMGLRRKQHQSWFSFPARLYSICPDCAQVTSIVCHNFTYILMYMSFQFNSVAQLCPTLCDPMNCSTPGRPTITNSGSPPKPMSIKSVMPSNHLILCPLLLLPSIFPSIRVFSSESALHIRWPNIGVAASTSVLPVNIQD